MVDTADIVIERWLGTASEQVIDAQAFEPDVDRLVAEDQGDDEEDEVDERCPGGGGATSV
ncbi:hypothetical protein [Chondromyces crocatus]|nr:hypothetical protein [Chondromyces crocatus]